VALCVLILTACHGDSSDAPLTSTTPHIKKAPVAKGGPTPEEQTAGMVEAATIGKSTVPVAVKFDLGSTPVLGQPLDIAVAIMPQIPADSVSLQSTGSDGLRVTPDSGPIGFPSVEPTQVYRHTVNLVPSAEGVQLLGLSVALQHDEITETRTFAIPIIVAPQ
jgi:hypothetical protein